MKQSRTTITHPFEPVYNSKSRILILGSFPSVVSREKNFYYANKTNRFWKVMEHLFDTAIDDPKTFVLEHGIALWDVIYSCEISGSSDASITNVVVNDIQKLIDCTEIRYVFTTGKTAEKLFRQYVKCNKELIPLPSSSAANARMKLLDLIEAYQPILEKLYE